MQQRKDNPDFNVTVNDFYENMACALINRSKSNLVAKRNNIDNNGIDLIVSDGATNHLVDVQYSFNFRRFGDIRIDLLSSGIRKSLLSTKEVGQQIANSDESSAINDLFNHYHIKKLGKTINNESNVSGVLYFFYHDAKPQKLTTEYARNKRIDFMVYLPNFVVVNEINTNWKKIKKHIRVNDKRQNGLSDKYDSAFICLNMRYLISKYNLSIFENKEDFFDNFKI